MYVFHASTSNVIRIALDTAGLTNATSGLIISTICDNEASPTVYTVAASNIETITTLGTYSAPSANKCRFKEVDATNHPKVYEIQFANARFAVANAKRMIVTVSGGGITTPTHFLIMLPQGTTMSGYQYQSVYVHSFSEATATPQIETAVDSSNTATSVTNILSKMLKYFRLALRKDAAVATDHATEAAEINADTGTGAGSYANTTESQEAIRDAITEVSASLNGNVSVESALSDDGTMTLYNHRRYDGTAHDKVFFTVAKDYQGASSISLIIHQKDDVSVEYLTTSATATSTTNIDVDLFTATFTGLPAFSGCPPFVEARYSLVATWASGDEEVSSGPCYILDKPT